MLEPEPDRGADDASNWPFPDPAGTAVMTLRRVMDGAAPVLQVQHLGEDAGWAFLDGEAFEPGDGVLATLRSVVNLDRTLRELGDLQEGWIATRLSVGTPWRRQRDDYA